MAILTAELPSSKAIGTGEGNDEFCLMKYLFHTSKDSLTCLKILLHGATALLPFQRRRKGPPVPIVQEAG
jgi:hypothetical protein